MFFAKSRGRKVGGKEAYGGEKKTATARLRRMRLAHTRTQGPLFCAGCSTICIQVALAKPLILTPNPTLGPAYGELQKFVNSASPLPKTHSWAKKFITPYSVQY